MRKTPILERLGGLFAHVSLSMGNGVGTVTFTNITKIVINVRAGHVLMNLLLSTNTLKAINNENSVKH